MINKTTLPTRENYLEQFLELSKTISAETITETFDSNSLREVFSENKLSSLQKDNVLKDLKPDSTLLEVLSEIAKELNSDTFDFESLENFYKEFNLESTPPEWFRSSKAVKDSKKVGDFKKFYKIMFDMNHPQSPEHTARSFAECMKNYFYLSSKDYETIRNEFGKLFRCKKFGSSSNHSRLARFLFNPGINSFYKFLNSIFSANEKRIKAEFKIFYSFSKNKLSTRSNVLCNKEEFSEFLNLLELIPENYKFFINLKDEFGLTPSFRKEEDEVLKNLLLLKDFQKSKKIIFENLDDAISILKMKKKYFN